MATKEDDYTRYRAVGVIPYEIEDKLGRVDSVDKVVTTSMTIGTTATKLTDNPLGRRNFIRIKNTDGANNVYILTASGTTYSGGYPIAASISILIALLVLSMSLAPWACSAALRVSVS